MTTATEDPPQHPAARQVGADRNSVQVAYLWIKDQILSGKFAAGEVLPQGALAKRCNTSRGPIREALRLLQNQGLIEAETNQRARVASFSGQDLEQITASMIVNAGFAIASSGGKWSIADFRRMKKLADELEELAKQQGGTEAERSARTGRRQLTYRKLVMELCSHGGKPVTGILEDNFDRVAIFRQMASLRTGIVPEFPLSATIDDLRNAIAARDVRAIALALAQRMAELGHTALDRMGVPALGARIDDALTFVTAALSGDASPFRLPEITTRPGQTVSIRHDPDGTMRWSITPD